VPGLLAAGSRLRRLVARVPLLETALILVSVAVLVTLAVLGERQAQPAPLDSYSSYDAATGGYRGLYELLQREGVHVDRFEREPAFLDPSIDTLVYAEPLAFDPRQTTASPKDASDLEAWVRAGGRLLYLGYDAVAAKAKILSLPFAGTAALPPRRTPTIAASLGAAGVARIGSVPSGLRWSLPHQKAVLLYGDGGGPVIVRYPFGHGTVTAVIDQTLLDNANIAHPDRARLAYLLASPGNPAGVVAFDETAHGYLEPAHWWSVVPRPFAIALGIALVALLAALAGAAVRLGPPLLPRPRDDRSSADFIDALSTLLERGKAARAAMQDAEQSAARTVARSVGAADDASASEIAEHIENAELRGEFVTLTQLAQAGTADNATLVRTVALAQRLRKEFAPHARQRH
jgi:hypothetical protein